MSFFEKLLSWHGRLARVSDSNTGETPVPRLIDLPICIHDHSGKSGPASGRVKNIRPGIVAMKVLGSQGVGGC